LNSNDVISENVGVQWEPKLLFSSAFIVSVRFPLSCHDCSYATLPTQLVQASYEPTTIYSV